MFSVGFSLNTFVFTLSRMFLNKSIVFYYRMPSGSTEFVCPAPVSVGSCGAAHLNVIFAP